MVGIQLALRFSIYRPNAEDFFLIICNSFLENDIYI